MFDEGVCCLLGVVCCFFSFSLGWCDLICPGGEIVYADDRDIVTRYFLWRQAEKGKITETSKRCVVICELLAAMGEDIVQRAKSLIEEKFSSVLGGTLSGMVVLR